MKNSELYTCTCIYCYSADCVVFCDTIDSISTLVHSEETLFAIPLFTTANLSPTGWIEQRVELHLACLHQVLLKVIAISLQLLLSLLATVKSYLPLPSVAYYFHASHSSI